MFLINPKLINNNQNSDSINCLLEDIDKKILSISTIQYTNDIYSLKQIVDLDLYDDLCEFREILIDKMMGCNCLVDGPGNETFLIFIMSKIKNLLNQY